MKKFLILLGMLVLPVIASAQSDVPITDIGARSRLAVGISRRFDSNLAFEKDEVGLFYSFGVTKHVNLAANVNYAFNVVEGYPIDANERFGYMVGIRFGLGVK